MKRSLFLLMLSIFSLSIISAIEIPTSQADVTLINDRFEVLESYQGMGLAVGDFNGDQIDDFAVSLKGKDSTWTEVNIILGNPTGRSSLTGETALRVITPLIVNNDVAHVVQFGDLNNDKKQDLIISMGTASYPGVAILYGRPLDKVTPESIDLTQSAPDVMIQGGSISTMDANPSFGVSDFTGDGISDLVIGLPHSDQVYLIPGRLDFDDVLDVSSDSTIRLFKGLPNSLLGTHVGFGNILGDPTPDLVISAPYSDYTDRIRAGIIYIIDGSQSFPSEWDLGTQSANAEIYGNQASFMDLGGIGDINGDGFSDLLLTINITKTASGIIDGSHFVSTSSIDLAPWSPNYTAPIPVTGEYAGTKGGGSDFDGDGHGDIFMTQLNGLHVFLSGDVTGWPTFPAEFSNPSSFLSQKGYIKTSAMGDFNGDGFDDLLIAEEAHGDYWGAMHIIYGFKPLANPMVHARQSTVRTTKVTVDLGVNGDPTEMKLSGEMVDSFKDQWIPYGTAQEVTLSPDAGSKSIEVVFRNAFHRESVLATDRVTLTVEENGAEVATNLITPNQTARINVNLPAAGRFKAVVFTRLGEQVITLWNEERGPGVWPVDWDGTNREGKRVAPGVYVMVIEAGGQTVKEKILVKE